MVVVVGLTVVVPVADADVNAPGVIVTDDEPVVVQERVVLFPATKVVGLAVKAEMLGGGVGAGAEPLTATVKEMVAVWGVASASWHEMVNDD